MTGNTRARRLNPSWYYLLPEVAAPLGGGLIKLGRGSTWAAVGVGLAPYALLAALYAAFIIGYAPAVICYLFFNEDKADQLITTSACAIVALVTLKPPAGGSSRTRRPGKPGSSYQGNAASRRPDPRRRPRRRGRGTVQAHSKSRSQSSGRSPIKRSKAAAGLASRHDRATAGGVPESGSSKGSSTGKL
jgi:hypothetical protein